MFESREVERSGVRGPDPVAVEEPLEIRVEGDPLAIMMRTPGHDRELAAGFLLTEGVIEGLDDLGALGPVGEEGNTIDCRLSSGVQAHRAALDRAQRDLTAHSGCGICGKRSIDQVHTVASVPVGVVRLSDKVLGGLPAALRAAQAGFLQTGGLHGAALVRPDGSLAVVREDIGRHNAVDKVIGWRVLGDGVPVHDVALLVSSRAGFEIVQKARMAGIGTVVALGAASTLAVDLTTGSGMVLYGFVRKEGYTRY